MSTISYGIDLSGYSSGKTALVKAEKSENSIKLEIIEEHPFKNKRKGTDGINVTKEEVNDFEKIIESGKLYIDVPIDLQGLPEPDNPEYIWQLTSRPVDRAFGALLPLADRIGACVSRFKYLLKRSGKEEELGANLFETYPAASLKLMGLKNEKYKGNNGVVFIKYEWKAIGGDKKDENLASILNSLGWRSSDNTKLNDDEFDAALCAIIGISPENSRLQQEELDKKINQLLNVNDCKFKSPDGYILLKEKSESVHIERISHIS